MSGSSFGDGVRKFISFIVFLVGIMTIAFGAYLLIDSLFISKGPLLFEGSIYTLVGLLIAFVADLGMTNRQMLEQNEHLLKQNSILNQRLQGGQSGGLAGMIGRMFGQGNVITNIEILDEEGNALNPQSGTTIQYEDATSERVQSEVKQLMIETGLDEASATQAVFLKDKDKKTLEKALEKAIEKEQYELARFIKNLLNNKKD